MNATASLTETVQSMYAAFQRGDVAAILAQLHPEVKWGANVEPTAPGATVTPTFRGFSGPAEVGKFFELLGRDLEFHAFEPVSFTSNEREVISRVLIDTTVRPTKRRVRVESLHHFTFDAQGRLVRFREFTDTLAIAAAWESILAAK